MDEWALLDEVDVIALWPKDHQKNVESSKWQERKEALEVLAKLIEKNPRLSTASMTIYGEVMDNLKKIIAHDSNVNVVIVALHVLCGLARGLRNRFSCFVSMIWPVLLDKAKDKKSTVQDALSSALDAVSDSCEFDRITKDLCEHLSKPNPQSKQCLCSFLFRYLARQDVLSVESAKAVLPIVVKLASDSSPSVRDAACSALGSARRLLGKGLDAFLNPISGEKAKFDKVEEFCCEAKKLHAEFNASRLQSVSSDKFSSGDHNEEMHSDKAMSSAELKDVDPWTLMEPIDLVAQMRKDFDELVISKKWQERKEAFDSIVSMMESAPRVAISPQLQQIMTTLLKAMDKDVNINVSSSCAKALTKLAVSMRTDFAVMVPKVMPVVFDKLKEKKPVLRNELVELCDAAAMTVPLDCYADAVCEGLAKSNPQSRAQTALFLSRLLTRHNSSTFPTESIKQIIPFILKCSSDADGEVREAAFRVMAAILRCAGMPASKRLFGEVTEDKVRMAKVVEYSEKLREEFGDQAAPEILRLYADIPKNAKEPTQESAASVKSSNAVHVTKKSSSSQLGSNRAPTVSAQLPQMAPRVVPRTPVQPPSNQRRANGVPTSSNRQQSASHERAPFDSQRGRQTVQQRLPASGKPASSAMPSRISHAPVRPVFAPNVVRTTANAAKSGSSVPVRPVANCKVTNGQSHKPPGFAGKNTSTSLIGSGLRPPAAVARVNTGIPRRSRPNSPAN
ncbi:hypothetical protein KIN20_015750 [Parelaphostrongylus tenuis]|uniref:TOG domain-containing protein n=1 Tax=Parelaphostrongylus tenuis TaxID=148309 RepID=A0AAD5MGI6_PARTN|nr:hypothetical protein KIN20_015750 [Parelaphostrongylus tenuis]